MKALEEKILKSGTCIGTEILKVDNFLNHQLDVKFIEEMGEEIARIYKDKKPTKILTIETSGIIIGAAASRAMGYIPVVFAKKMKPSTMNTEAFEAECTSFTKGTTSIVRVDKRFLSPDDRLIIVDDFLARGQAGLALIEIANQAGAQILGFTAAIEKKAQGGSDLIRAKGVYVQSLAVVEKMQDGVVYFEQED